jgi:hypothetical protein
MHDGIHESIRASIRRWRGPNRAPPKLYRSRHEPVLTHEVGGGEQTCGARIGGVTECFQLSPRFAVHAELLEMVHPRHGFRQVIDFFERIGDQRRCPRRLAKPLCGKHTVVRQRVLRRDGPPPRHRGDRVTNREERTPHPIARSHAIIGTRMKCQ